MSDTWRIEPEEASHALWLRDAKVNLQHVATNAWLWSSSTKRYQRPIDGQQEVAAARTRSLDTAWRTAEGVFYGADVSSKANDEL